MTEHASAGTTGPAPSAGGLSDDASADVSARAMTIVLMASIATIGANSLALGPIAPAVARALASDEVSVMRAAAGYGLGTALGALALSPLVDRLGAHRALTVALGVLALVFGASAAVPSVGWLVGTQSVAGLAAGLGLPAIYAFAAQIAPRGRESRVLGRVLVGWTVSLVVGVSLSAVVADLGSWRAVYAAFAALSVAASFAVRRAPRTATPAPGPTGAGAVPTAWPVRTLGIPGVLPLLLTCFGFMAAFYGMYSYVGAHVHGTLGQPVRASAWVTLSYGAGFGLAAFGDGLIDRFGAAKALAPTFAIVVLVYVGFALGAGSFGAVIALAFVWGAINHVGLNLIVAGLSAIDPVRRGAILGAYSATTYLSGALGTLAFGRVYAAAGFASVAWVAAAVVAIMAAAGLAAARVPARARRARGDASRAGSVRLHGPRPPPVLPP